MRRRPKMCAKQKIKNKKKTLFVFFVSSSFLGRRERSRGLSRDQCARYVPQKSKNEETARALKKKIEINFF